MSVMSLLISARDAIRRAQQRRHAYAELMALDDRFLADIGVHRSEISRLVWGGPALQASPVAAATDPAPAGPPHGTRVAS
jgi:uncharacterized protein YjiS (DUF1127 family)